MLHPPTPPFAIATASFRFPALAALAGRLPIGAGRETVLATLLTARVAAGSAPPAPLAQPVRAARAAAARQWLTAMCPDAQVRSACTALAESTAGDDPGSVAKALARVMEVTAQHLDGAARSELASLAADLRG